MENYTKIKNKSLPSDVYELLKALESKLDEHDIPHLLVAGDRSIMTGNQQVIANYLGASAGHLLGKAHHREREMLVDLIKEVRDHTLKSYSKMGGES